mmetsp:Transcript_31063/g.73840  ORF Transcript_31063/g.73840 Transcript_31063/m.73840 type:complete len:198 (-) Transcript_31063:83-676(-)
MQWNLFSCRSTPFVLSAFPQNFRSLVPEYNCRTELSKKRMQSDGSYSTVSGNANSRGSRAVDSPKAVPVAREESPAQDIIQYVVLRRDLWTELSWPLGSIVAQACHASTAILWETRNDPVVGEYCSSHNLDSMRKVVLEIKGETQLRNLSAKLSDAGIPHKLWVEQPEDFPTCLATKPCLRSDVAPFFKKLQLCKGL